MSVPPPGGVDRRVHALRPGLVRTLVWVAVNLVVLLATAALAIALVAVPPLSLLPSDEPLRSEDAALGTVYALLTWPVHLALVAALSRSRLARLWSTLSAPVVLSLVTFLLPLLLAAVDSTNRAVVLGYLLYGLLCRLHPRRWDPRPSPVSGA